ncbi:MAG TPA: hypothetical protein PLU65_02070, partial [Dokdonella sp.]|nr:hypothetical protein [Dokdonella sp.]
SLSDLSTDALALTSDQLCENFSNISTPSVAKDGPPSGSLKSIAARERRCRHAAWSPGLPISPG